MHESGIFFLGASLAVVFDTDRSENTLQDYFPAKKNYK